MECLFSMGGICKEAGILCTFKWKQLSLLNLINNVSKGTVQKMLHVTLVNQFRLFMFTDTDTFIIVILQVVAWAQRLKNKYNNNLKNGGIATWKGGLVIKFEKVAWIWKG